MPLVSVLLPVRDAEPWLEASAASLARQTLEDYEVVAVNDGSRDGSGAMLAPWILKQHLPSGCSSTADS